MCHFIKNLQHYTYHNIEKLIVLFVYFSLETFFLVDIICLILRIVFFIELICHCVYVICLLFLSHYPARAV